MVWKVDNRGERCGKAKLKEAHVIEILGSTDKHAYLAVKYGVHHSTISDIKRRRRWKHVEA